MRVWLDDVRPAPQGWTWAKTYDEATALLDNDDVQSLSLDHDIACFRADGREMTGYDVLMFVVERNVNGGKAPEEISIHSANPVGRARMQGVIDRYLI